MKEEFKLQVDDHVELLLLDDSHAGELFELTDTNREYLRTWLPWLDSNKYLQNTIDFIKFSRKQYSENVSLNLAVRHTGRLSGIIGFHRFDWLNHSTSIGYWLGESCQGKGLITRSCRVLLDYAFNNMGLNRIEIKCAPGNSKSRAVPERLGFKNEGVLRQAEWLYDHYVDHVVYGMLRAQWLKTFEQ